MAVNFPPAGLVINNINIDLPLAHPLNQSQFSLLSTPNAAAGTRTYNVQLLQGLGLALARRDPNNEEALDAVFYAISALDIPAIFGALAGAVNAGFAHGVAPSGSVRADGFAVIRAALVWAQDHLTNLRPLTAADFYALPALGGGAGAANASRFRMAYSLYVETGTLLLRAAVEMLCLSGFVHDAASRANGSNFAQVFDQLVDALSQPPVATQPQAVANALLRSGLPPLLTVYPVTMGERYPHTMLRLNYVGGSFPERRSAFATYARLLIVQFPTLRGFLEPAVNEDQLVDAYTLMAQRIYTSPQPPSDQAIFHLRTVSELSTLLRSMPEVPQAANALVPVGDASHRSQAAVAEWDRRRNIQNAGPTGAVGGANAGAGVTHVPASKALRQQFTATLMPLPFFGPADADLVRLHAAAPTNEYPILKRATSTLNVIFFQVSMGVLRGVTDVSPGLRILEAASTAWPKYVDHVTVMDKAGAPVPGHRPAGTLTYSQETFTQDFLSNNREKFMSLKFLALSGKIKAARERVLEPAALSESDLFAQMENLHQLRYFAHHLEAYEFARTGPGSWDDAVTRLETFRQTGTTMPGQSQGHHLNNCMAAYNILKGDLFDAVGHYAQHREASDVGLLLSTRVFEAGGTFDRHLQHQSTQTSTLNEFILLNPAFAVALSGPSQPGTSGGGDGRGNRGGKAKKTSPSRTYQWSSGQILQLGGAGGSAYNCKLIWVTIKKELPGTNQGNFCILEYLNGQPICESAYHKSKGLHKFSAAAKALRDSFEHQPYRTDAGAKPKAS